MVAHTGFEPVISSLRGTRPRPLDECANNKDTIILLLNCSKNKKKPGTQSGVLQVYSDYRRLKHPQMVEPFVSKI